MNDADDRPEDNEGERKLERCPFCGGVSERRTWAPRSPATNQPVGIRHNITCIECGVSTSWKETAGEAIAAWNRRHRTGAGEGGGSDRATLLEALDHLWMTQAWTELFGSKDLARRLAAVRYRLRTDPSTSGDACTCRTERGAPHGDTMSPRLLDPTCSDHGYASDPAPTGSEGEHRSFDDDTLASLLETASHSGGIADWIRDSCAEAARRLRSTSESGRERVKALIGEAIRYAGSWGAMGLSPDECADRILDTLRDSEGREVVADAVDPVSVYHDGKLVAMTHLQKHPYQFGYSVIRREEAESGTDRGGGVTDVHRCKCGDDRIKGAETSPSRTRKGTRRSRQYWCDNCGGVFSESTDTDTGGEDE